MRRPALTAAAAPECDDACRVDAVAGSDDKDESTEPTTDDTAGSAPRPTVVEANLPVTG